MAEQDDDFGAQLGSMDRAQLRALAEEYQQRMNQGFALSNPGGGKAPTIHSATPDPHKWTQTSVSDYNTETFRDTAGLASGYGAYKRYTRSKSDRKKKKKYDEAMRAEKARQSGIAGERLRSIQGQLKTLDMRDKVNTQFKDMDMEGLFKRIADQGLQANMLGITQQYEDFSRQGGFGAAQTGLSGSSVDAERLADTDAAEQGDRSQAVAQSQNQLSQMTQQSDMARRQLLDSVSSSNPGEEARLGGELANIQNQANSFGQNAQGQMWQQQNNAAGMNGQSQALGGLLSTYSTLYTQNNRQEEINRRGY
jgi:hypothetical protein